MTLVAAQPAPMGGSILFPYFPWSPQDVENLLEVERKAYLTYLRTTRDQLFKRK